MLTTQMTIWIIRQANILGAIFGLLSAYSIQASAQADAPCLRYVKGTFGISLAQDPGGRIAGSSNAPLGIVLEEKHLKGHTWRRLLLADGTTGWSDATHLDAAAEVGVEFVPETSQPGLLQAPALAPDAISNKTLDRPGVGCIIGLSESQIPYDPYELMLPARLRTWQYPWIDVRMHAAQGYAHLNGIRLLPERTSQQDQRVASVSTSYPGLTRAPFFWLTQNSHLATQTAPGSIKVDYALDTADAGICSPVGRSDTTVREIFRSPRDPRQSLITYAPKVGSGELFVVYNRDKPSMLACQAEDRVSLLMADTVDLDGNGSIEWIFVTASIFGDGFYSHLWHLDPTCEPHKKAPAIILLSRGSGEQGDWTIGDWAIDQQTLWIGGHGPSKSWLLPLSYRDCELHWQASETVFFAAGQPRLRDGLLHRWRTYAEGLAADGYTLPIGTGESPFLFGRAFLHAASAMAWMAQHPGFKLQEIAKPECKIVGTSGEGSSVLVCNQSPDNAAATGNNRQRGTTNTEGEKAVGIDSPAGRRP